ncbi:MAG TPA: SCP2 sterol-binding domain-containing protein [Thermoplasmata archaeon]|nr:SCP2 sterol-binding domain-containing protein [Thermoplasmata archaeon]
MATKEEVIKALEEVKAKFEDPTLKKKFGTFTKNMQFTFSDLGTSFAFEIVNGEVKSMEEKEIEKPDISATTDSETFLGIANKSISSMHAYTSGKIKVKGAMTDLLKLQKIL